MLGNVFVVEEIALLEKRGGLTWGRNFPPSDTAWDEVG